MIFEGFLALSGFFFIFSVLIVGFSMSEYSTKKYIKKHLKNGVSEKQIIDLLLES